MEDNLAMEETTEKKRNPYFYVFIIVMSFMVYGLCQYKIQPILVYLMESMSINEARAGLLTSSVGLVGVFITIPLGVLITKVGSRKMGIYGIITVLIGSLIGTFSTSNFTGMIISQVVIGAGGAFIGILGPYTIASLFKPELRGAANGWYITAGTLAQLVMYNLVPRITTPTSLAPAWWFTNVFAVVMLFVWIATITDEVAPPLGQDSGKDATSLKTILAALKNSKTLQLTIGGGAMMMSAIGILYFTPTYLIVERGYSAALAGSLVSGSAIVGAVSTAVGGTLSDKLKTRKWIYFIAIAWMAVSRVLLVILPNGIWLNLTIWGQGIPSVTMGLLYTVASEVIEPRQIGLSIATIGTGVKIGALFASALFGVIVASFGYAATYYMYAALTCFAFIGVCTIKGVK